MPISLITPALLAGIAVQGAARSGPLATLDSSK
jgi:hypothetical protein